MTYAEKLRDPRWIRRREQIIERDNHQCTMCGRTERLEVHHKAYEQGREPWEYPDSYLCALCDVCHERVTLLKEKLGWLISTEPEFELFSRIADKLETIKSEIRMSRRLVEAGFDLDDLVGERVIEPWSSIVERALRRYKAMASVSQTPLPYRD